MPFPKIAGESIRPGLQLCRRCAVFKTFRRSGLCARCEDSLTTEPVQQWEPELTRFLQSLADYIARRLPEPEPLPVLSSVTDGRIFIPAGLICGRDKNPPPLRGPVKPNVALAAAWRYRVSADFGYGRLGAATEAGGPCLAYLLSSYPLPGAVYVSLETLRAKPAPPPAVRLHTQSGLWGPGEGFDSDADAAAWLGLRWSMGQKLYSGRGRVLYSGSVLSVMLCEPVREVSPEFFPPSGKLGEPWKPTVDPSREGC